MEDLSIAVGGDLQDLYFVMQLHVGTARKLERGNKY
jgi:hypothetical protein